MASEPLSVEHLPEVMVLWRPGNENHRIFILSSFMPCACWWDWGKLSGPVDAVLSGACSVLVVSWTPCHNTRTGIHPTVTPAWWAGASPSPGPRSNTSVSWRHSVAISQFCHTRVQLEIQFKLNSCKFLLASWATKWHDYVPVDTHPPTSHPTGYLRFWNSIF